MTSNTPISSPRRRPVSGQTPDSLEQKERLHLEERKRLFEAQVREALVAADKTVDMSVPPHRVITEVLYKLAYEVGDPAVLKIHYGDGSTGKPLKLRVLRARTSARDWQEDAVVRLGTLSFRHLDYDYHVDRYLIRDRETRLLSNGGIDGLATERMRELLQDPCLKEGPTCIRVFQTGLEPLVVGMYRAVIEHLEAARERGLPPVLIHPVFFLSNKRSSADLFWL